MTLQKNTNKIKASKKVMAFEFHLPFHLEIARILNTEHDWDFVYWSADAEAMGSQVTQLFPSIIFHDSVSARFGRPPEILNNIPIKPYDENIAKFLSYDETIVLKMMDRIDAMNTFTYKDRVRHYHNLVAWWQSVLTILNPDIVIFPSAPHVIYDYVAYAICKYLSIKTIMFENGSIPNILLPVERFEDGFPYLIRRYQDIKSHDTQPSSSHISFNSTKYLKLAQGSYEVSKQDPLSTASSAVRFKKMYDINYLVTFFKKLKQNIYQFDRIPSFILAIARDPFIIINYLNPNIRRLTGFYKGRFLAKGEANFWDEIYHAIYVYFYLKNLSIAYSKLSGPVDMSKKYIYVPLHVQPERSTSPNGGIYDHSYLLISAISSIIPDDWYIYIKEHPSQFATWQIGERGRNKSDYNNLLKIKNVRFASLDSPPFELIDNSQAVATITGSSGWEAVARGVPVLCFGVSWYQGCSGVYDVRNISNLKEALTEIIQGSRPDGRCVKDFLRALEHAGFYGYLDDDGKSVSNISAENNIMKISKIIYEMG